MIRATEIVVSLIERDAIFYLNLPRCRSEWFGTDIKAMCGGLMMLGMGRKQPMKLTEAMKLSMCVNAAADEFETEKEQFETIEIAFRGFAKYLAECESAARLRGSPRAGAFAVVGRATQAFALGTARVAAALPAVDPKAQLAAQVVLGLQEESSEEVDA